MIRSFVVGDTVLRISDSFIYDAGELVRVTNPIVDYLLFECESEYSYILETLI